jgi:hypothetical protein
MGETTSAVIAETFIQYLEHTKIIKILNKHQIIYYHRYVDILIIYNMHTTNRDHNEIQCSTPQNKIYFEKETQ